MHEVILICQLLQLAVSAWLVRKVTHMSAQGDAIKAVVEKIRTAVAALIERLSDNVTAEEQAEITATGAAIEADINLLDPATPEGPITPDSQ